VEAISEPAGRGRAFHALRHRDFRLLWSGQTISLIGDMAFLTALGWKTFTIAGSNKLGLVLAAQGAGLLATLLIGGALADRYDRRSMMIVSDLWRFAAVAALAALDFSGRLDFSSLIVLATIVGLGDGFFYPAVGGIVPLVVNAAQLPSANSLMGVARWSSVLAGPSLAASSTTAPAPPGCSRSTRSRSWPRQP
jgi:MFS family permease